MILQLSKKSRQKKNQNRKIKLMKKKKNNPKKMTKIKAMTGKIEVMMMI